MTPAFEMHILGIDVVETAITKPTIEAGNFSYLEGIDQVRR